MRKQFWAGLIVMTCGAMLGAQTPDQTTATQRSSSQSAANQITVTGCIERAGATSGATGTTGTTGAPSSSESGFILTKASMSGSSGAFSSGGATTGTTAGTAGATTPPSAAASGSTYHLDADSSKLSPHVGHKVEITGTLEKSASSSSSSTTSSTTTTTSSSSMSSGPKLKVDTVRMIASSCSE